MARRRFGIFKRDSEEEPDGGAGDAEAEDDYSVVDPEQDPDPSFDPGEHEFVPASEAAKWSERSVSETAEWSLPDEDDASDETPQPAVESGNGTPPEPGTGDTAERIRTAAQNAAQKAEERAMDEILALEEDLERAKDEAAGQLKVIEGRLGDAERRAGDADRRAEDAERRAAEAEERIAAAESTAEQASKPAEEAEDRGRAAAAKWLRDRLEVAREEADERLAKAVEEARAEERIAAAESAAEQTSTPAEEAEVPSQPPVADAEELRAEAEDRGRAGAAKWLRDQLELAREEADERLAKAVEGARAETEERLRAAREEELVRQTAAIEGELTAAREQLSEANARAAAAERRAELEISSRREATRDPEPEPVADESAAEADGKIEEAQPKRRRTSLRTPGILRPRRSEADRSGAGEEPEPQTDQVASIAELSAEAEELGGSTRGEVAESELEPPTWIAKEEPEPEAKEEPEPEPDAGAEPEPEALPEPPPAAEVPEGMLSLSVAELEDLLQLGMSVTQAKRVLLYRDEHGGFTSVDQLDQVPGFPRAFLDEIKDGLVP